MIIGSLTFETNQPDSKYINKIKGYNCSKEVEYSDVISDYFEGAYFFHKNLPYKSEDYFFLDNNNNILVLISGSVYNKLELLDKTGFPLDVSTPRLIARLFILEGPDFVKNLNGDFTIFILRSDSAEAYLFRDHLGVRPMAWISDQKCLFFSSDILGLCRAFSDSRQVNPDYLLGYFKYINYRKTPNEKVQKLLPGHYLRFSQTGTEIIRYWKPDEIRVDKELVHEKMLSDLKWLVTDSIKIRCDRKFTAASHVTGGLDSGIISAIARKEYANQVIFNGFSWSPEKYNSDNLKYDERPLILSLCRWIGIDPVFSKMNLEDLIFSVKRYYDNQGYFSEDISSDHVKDHKVNLVLSGWGGDDFISTAYRGIELDLLRKFKIFELLRHNQLFTPKKFFKRLLRYVIYPVFHILDKETKASFRNDAYYLKKAYKRSDRSAIQNYYFHSSRRQMHLRLLDFYHLQERCESWAYLGFSKGIEYRYPLLDKRIVEYMLKVPSELLCKSEYYRPVLREISEDLLPYDVRMQTDKSDPVCWTYMDELFRDAAVIFMEDVRLWKNNSDLSFIDFDLLEKDIEKFRANSKDFNPDILFMTIVYLKSIHEFTLIYRKK